MRAVYLENGFVSVRDLAPEPLPPGFARIRMLAAGICNTDLELLRGYYNFEGVPGHEFCGEVMKGSAEWMGRRVVGEINLACGRCEFCAQGMGRHCAARTVLGIVRHPGAFAETLTLPLENLRAVPDEVTTEQAVFTEPIAAACEILDQVAIDSGEPVAVLGDGKLGLSIAQVLHAHGAQVSLFGRHATKLALAAHSGIATVLTNGDLPRARYRIVVDATGSASGLRQAVAMAKPRGVVVMKSTVHGDTPLDFAPIIVNEITLVGSRCGRFEPALDLLRTGKVSVAPMIDSRFKLEDAAQAFARAAAPGVLKVLLTC